MTTFLPNITLTQELLKSLLRYDSLTGDFIWLVQQSGPARIGSKAGSLMPKGYIRITIARRRFMAHILAWFYMTGEYVSRGLDHRDTVRHNNAWNNLRKATKSQNSMNQKVRSDNKTGRKGVRLKKGRITRPYYSTITFGGKQRHLGYFDIQDEAAEAYAAAALKHFGEFARLA